LPVNGPSEGSDRRQGTEAAGSPPRVRGASSGNAATEKDGLRRGGRRPGGRRPRRDVRSPEDDVEGVGELPEDHTGDALGRPERCRPGAERPERERRRERGPLEDHTASPDDILDDHTGRSDERDDREAGRRGRGPGRGGTAARQGRAGRRQ